MIIISIPIYTYLSKDSSHDSQLFENILLSEIIFPYSSFTPIQSDHTIEASVEDRGNEYIFYDLMDIIPAFTISDFFVKKNELFLLANGGENFIYRIILSEDEILSSSGFGRRGRGPGEFSYPNNFGINNDTNQLIIFDQRNRRINFLDITNEGLEVVEQHMIDLDLGKFLYREGKIYANADFMDDRSIAIVESNHENVFSQVDAFSDAVFTIENTQLSPAVLVHLNRSWMAAHPEQEYLVKAHLYIPILQIFNVETGLVNEINTDEGFPINYRIERDHRENIDRFLRTRETMYSYLSVAASEDKIYALYSGRSESSTDNEIERVLGDILHILDWEGNLIETIQLNTEVNRIYFDSYTEKLFGINMYDDFRLVKFGLY